MIAQVIPFWQLIRQAIWGPMVPHDNPQRRLRITGDETRTLPLGARTIRVYSGGAWVSYLHSCVLLSEGQTLDLTDDPVNVVVTSIGRAPVVLELVA